MSETWLSEFRSILNIVHIVCISIVSLCDSRYTVSLNLVIIIIVSRWTTVNCSRAPSMLRMVSRLMRLLCSNLAKCLLQCSRQTEPLLAYIHDTDILASGHMYNTNALGAWQCKTTLCSMDTHATQWCTLYSSWPETTRCIMPSSNFRLHNKDGGLVDG